MDSEKAQIEVDLQSKEGDAMIQQEVTGPPRPGCCEGSGAISSSRCIEISTCDLVTASLCRDRHNRKLAISSVICGLTCVGVVSLIYSVKAREASNRETSEMHSRKARRYGIISIVLWVAILLFLPVLVVFVSYVLTLID